MRPFRSTLSLYPLTRPCHSRHLHAVRALRYQGAGAQGIQPVRVSRPRLTWRRLCVWGIYAGVTYCTIAILLNKLSDGIEIDADTSNGQDDCDDPGHNHKTKGKGEELSTGLDDDSDVSFFPLLYPKQLPRKFYKASDPEWQEFKKLQSDKDRKNAARDYLCRQLALVVASSRPLQHRVGKNIKYTKGWLDFVYPNGPPPEYSRKGILVTDDEVALATQTIPHSYYLQLVHMMWPSVIFGALKSSMHVFYEIQMTKAKSALGLELSKKEKRVVMARRLQQMRSEASAAIEEGPDVQQQVSGRKADRVGPHQVSSTNDESARDAEASGLKFPIPAVKIPNDIALSTQVFFGELGMGWRKSHTDYEPPGCCFVIGDVEVAGSKGFCRLAVRAAYDPKGNTYLYIHANPRLVSDRWQRAKGGL